MLGLGFASWRMAARVRAGPQAILGPSLLGHWDAERLDRMVLDGSAVASWTDLAGGHVLTQAVASARPLWSASGAAGRPAVVFDGTDDFLRMEAQPFPAGAAPSELWMLGTQGAAPTETGTRYAISYGGNSSGPLLRAVQRAVVSGANRARLVVGDGTGNLTVTQASGDFTGVHLVRATVGTGGLSVQVDGGAVMTASGVPGTGAARTTLGASNLGTGFWLGAIQVALVTAPLSDVQAAMLGQWLKDRGGIA